MNPTDLLDVVERLFNAAHHPDITGAERYVTRSGQRGVEVAYRSRAKAFLFLPDGEPVTAPADLPEVMPEYKFRPLYALQLLMALLDAARPAGLVAWRLVSMDVAELSPCGIEFRTENGVILLRVVGGSPTGPDNDPADWADWKVPRLG